MINVWSCTHFLIRIIWTVFELFFWTENRVSQGLPESMTPQSTTFEIGKVFLIFTHLCEWKKKVWVNFKRKVLYFRSSNHTSGEIRPATKSDIEVKTVSVTSVVKWHKPGICVKHFLLFPQKIYHQRKLRQRNVYFCKRK